MPSRISMPRILSGFGSGAAVTLAIFVFLAWPAWQYVLLIGGGLASILILVVGFPLFALLRSKQLLNVYFSIALGGLLSLVVPAGIVLINVFIASHPSESFLNRILETLLFFFLPGAVGGLVGWFVAAGWRVRAS